MATKARGNLATIDIHGKDYVTVAERVKAVTFEDLEHNKYQMVDKDLFEANGQWFLTITIAVGDTGKQYFGTSQINFGGQGVDRTSPFENAETSALGRALAFAGIGVIEGIASADEIANAQNRVAPSTPSKLASDKQQELIKTLMKTKAGVTTKGQAKRLLNSIVEADTVETLNVSQASTVIQFLTENNKEAIEQLIKENE